MQRRLSAILAADVVGYSRMMGADEAATLRALAALKAEVFGPIFASQKGEIVKSMGDGWLVEFQSAVGAVNAAMLVQDRLAHDGGLTLRIGVHIGDVTHSDGEVYGDGINIAARLEALAPEGGILISDAVYSSLDGTLTPSFEASGLRALKNIARPVGTWVRAGESPSAQDAARAAAQVEGWPTLTISPVVTMEAKPELEDIAQSLGADISTYFASVNWLVSRVTAQTVAGAYALSAVLRGQADRLRLETRLADPDGRVIWTHKSDGHLSDSFDWQDSVALQIAGQATDTILEVETLRLSTIPDASLSAEQCLLLGMMAWRALSPADFVNSAALQARAVAANPGLVDAYAEAILIVTSAQTFGEIPGMQPYSALLPHWVEAARPLAARHALLTLAIGIVTFREDGRTAPLNQTIAQALRLAPFDARTLGFAGWAHIWSGNPQAALDCFTKAMRFGRINFFFESSLGGAATASVQLGRDAEALEFARRGMDLTDEFPTLFAVAAAAHALLGQTKQANENIARYLKLVPGDTIVKWKAVNGYSGSAGGKRYFEGLRLAGLPEG